MPLLALTGRFRKSVSAAMFALCTLFAFLIVALLVLVIVFLVGKGLDGLSLSFFTEDPSGDPLNPGGMRHAIVGTLILIGLASLVGITLGMLTGIYLSEYSHERWLVEPVRFVCDVLAGVPSIVVGILGYELLVRPLGGFNAWAGALALAFLMVPIVARTTEEMLRLVPDSYRAASMGLGATKSQTIVRVVLPAATGSIVTGVMLALARIAGETAPLLFTVMGSRLLTVNPNEPFPSLTVQIYTYASGPYQAENQLAWAGILVLITILLVINLSVRWIVSRTTKIAK